MSKIHKPWLTREDLGLFLGGGILDTLPHAAEHEVGGSDLLAFADIPGFGDWLDQAVKEASNVQHASLLLNNTGLHVKDTNASHYLIIKPGSDITANRTLSLVTGDAARTITLQGNPTLADWFDQSVKEAAHVKHASITVGNEGLHILDTNASHDLIIKPGSDLTADRILTLVTGNTARTITLNGNPTLNDWFDQGVKQADSPTFDDLTISNPVNIHDTVYGLMHQGIAAGIGAAAPPAKIYYETDTGILKQVVGAAWVERLRSEASTRLTEISEFGDYLDQSVKQAASPTHVTVKLTALTDGYVPYHVSDAAGLANSPIFTDGTKVGIGTVSPETTLHVKSTTGVLISDITSAGGTQLLYFGSATGYRNYYVGMTATNEFSIGQAGTDNTPVGNALTPTIFINASNVGLGISPSYPLEVYTEGNQTHLIAARMWGGTFTGDNIVSATSIGAASGFYHFRAYSNSVDQFWVRGDGIGYFKTGVGIGTVSPGATLDVAGNILLSSSASKISFVNDAVNYYIQQVDATYGLRIQTYYGVSIMPRGAFGLRVTGDGKVGIGTLIPACQAQVYGAAPAFARDPSGTMFNILDSTAPAVNTGGTISLGGLVQRAAGGDVATSFGGIKGGRETFANDHYAGYLSFYTSSGGALWNEWMRITSLGAVIVNGLTASTLLGAGASKELKSLTTIAGLTIGHVLKATGATTVAFMANNLGGLSDVTFDDLEEGETLAYDQGDSMWVDAWGVEYDNPRLTWKMRTEFFKADPDTNDPWTGAPLVAGGGLSDSPGETNHPGVIRLNCGNALHSGYYFMTSLTALIISGRERSEFVFKTAPVMTAKYIRMGFQDSITEAMPTDGIFLNIAEAVFSGKTYRAGAPSTTGTSYNLVAGTWYRGTLSVNDDIDLVTFNLYSAAGNLLWGPQTLAANIPTATLGHGVLAYIDDIDLAGPVIYIDMMVASQAGFITR